MICHLPLQQKHGARFTRGCCPVKPACCANVPITFPIWWTGARRAKCRRWTVLRLLPRSLQWCSNGSTDVQLSLLPKGVNTEVSLILNKNNFGSWKQEIMNVRRQGRTPWLMTWKYHKYLRIPVRLPAYVHAWVKKYHHLRQKIKPSECFQTVRAIKIKD